MKIERLYAAAERHRNLSVRESDQSAFDRFTADANQVIVLAQSEAKRLGDTQLDTEHLLLGLLRADDGLAADVLAASGVTVAAARDATAGLVVTRANGGSGEMLFTPRAKRTLERALREALSTEEDEIAPHHILLALLDQRDGLATQIVQDLELDLSAIYDAIQAGVERPEVWPSVKVRLEERTLRRLDAVLLAAESGSRVFEAIAGAASGGDARKAIAAILDIDDATAAYITRQPLLRFTPARITSAERARRELLRRRDAPEGSDPA